ncbi:PQQ-binding-like beta-propeller repeat protein [Cellulomonas cellasea]|uniref:Outer membrane protein assembly factor BamB n=1 Tax=Cellulomonas cellasea TaxID=43670 RepID=A0A7W4UJM9_9CELL|nr:PQQ-binding-like beta-propeller repeat protein [Cellulomonas cellasea]MBB2925362.1 outer membrane protein assembly factor BamB [Cellulomonas cellasea]
MGRGDMQAVELVPGDAPDPVPAAPPEADRPRLGRRARRTLVVVALLLCAALVGTQLVLDARERTRLARLATVPHVLAPLGDDLEVRWEADGVVGHLVRTGVRAGDLLVGTFVGDDGVPTVRAVRAPSGEQVWSTALGASSPGTVLDPGFGPACQADEERPGGPVVCLVTGVADVDGDARPGVPSWAEVVVLDPTTGEVLARRPTEPSTRVAVLGEDLVRARGDDSGRLLVTAEDPLTGTERWRFSVPEPLAVDRSFGVLISLWVTGGHLQIAETQGRTWLLSPDGRLLHATTTGSEVVAWPEALRGGRVGLVSYEGSGSTRLLLEDGSPGPLLPGVPAFTSVDDGSVPGLVLTADERFHAWDARTGRAVWRSERIGDGAVPWTDALLLDGALYGADASGRVVSLDAATGATRWTATFVPSADRSVWTDGRMVLVLELTPDGHRQLSGFALADGSRVFTGALPDVEVLTSSGRLLFGIPDFGSDRVLALG